MMTERASSQLAEAELEVADCELKQAGDPRAVVVEAWQ
jgi:hypothetical protein